MQDRQSIFLDSNDFIRKSLQLPILKEHEGSFTKFDAIWNWIRKPLLTSVKNWHLNLVLTDGEWNGQNQANTQTVLELLSYEFLFSLGKKQLCSVSCNQKAVKARVYGYPFLEVLWWSNKRTFTKVIGLSKELSVSFFGLKQRHNDRRIL